MNNERKNAITFKGSPLTLIGQEVKVGNKAPDCTVLNAELQPVSLSSFNNKVCVLITVPSLDTAVCSRESRRFNLEAEKWKDQVETVVVSMDLPFAQARWCGAEGIQNLHVFSDFRDREVGQKYGVFIKELGLLARCVFVIDKDHTIRSIQLVKETTSEPDYAKVSADVQNLLTAKR